VSRTRAFLLAVLLVSAFAAVAVACGDDDDSGGGGGAAVGDGASGTRSSFDEKDGKLKVATTVAPLTSIVLNIGGNRIHLHGLIPDGVDSHTFEPKPSDAKVLSRADMLIMNGAHLEGSTEKIARENLKDPSKIFKLADNTLSGDDPRTGFLYDFSFPKSEGSPNPHLWMNPLYALRYADLTRGWLSEADPENASYYQANFDAFAKTLNQLDAAIRKDQESVPAANRKLLTYHDSWAYWAREYGWTVIGAIQPSDFKEPSASEVAGLINQIKAEKVPAVFGSEVFPSKTLKTIADETNATFEDHLSDDAPPGKVGDKNHTYIGMLVEDMQIMFKVLGGHADTVATVPVENSFGK
jgi:manganese/iron transport system substrate-binding protein